MTKRRGVVFALSAFSFFLLSFRPAWTEGPDYLEEEDLAEYTSARVTKTIGGLIFDVEADRPIEKVNGVYRPVSTDTYVAIKFKKLRQEFDKRLMALEERLEGLESAVERLEERCAEVTPIPAAATPAPEDVPAL